LASSKLAEPTETHWSAFTLFLWVLKGRTFVCFAHGYSCVVEQLWVVGGVAANQLHSNAPFFFFFFFSSSFLGCEALQGAG
jgi:hypothetical protein